VNRFCSIFSQLLKLFPHTEFQQLVKKTGVGRKGFASWDQFVAMVFCQLGRAQSLREICGGLRSCEGKLSHLGVAAAPSRSTLAYANARRPAMLFELIFYELLERCRSVANRAGTKFRFKNELVSLDATVIDLCASLFDWAKYQRTKGAVKLHLVLDYDGYLPALCVITEGKRADLKVARRLRFEPGTILIFDRGYIDYGWFSQLTASGVFFVTRARKDISFEIVEHRVPAIARNVVADQIVKVQDCQWQLRRVELYVPETDETLVSLTNHLELGASTVAAIYKERWQIELFFKALKQNLKIKTFVGISPNALRVQVWTALIAILLLRFLQLRSRFAWSLSNLVALLRMNLFVHRDL
jgi:Transposase DDE domain/Domain of unknown function (DUF4372)